MSADWSTLNAPVRSLTSAGMMSPGRTRTMSPGTSSRAGTTCQSQSRRTRALTCKRRRSVSTTPAARCSCAKLRTALTTRSAPTTARSEYFPSNSRQDHDQFEHPRRQAPEFSEECEDRMPFCTATSLEPCCLPPGLDLRMREACLGARREGGEGVGNGRGCDVRRLGCGCPTPPPPRDYFWGPFFPWHAGQPPRVSARPPRAPAATSRPPPVILRKNTTCLSPRRAPPMAIPRRPRDQVPSFPPS